MNDGDIAALLKKSQHQNAISSLTGMLLYLKGDGNGHFIQVLEGDQLTVRSLFDKIVKDLRHYDITIVSEAAIEKRSFSEWFLGFKAADSKAFHGQEGYLDADDISGYQAKPKDFNTSLNYLKTFYYMYNK